VIQTSYPLGANTGFTFQQTYGATTVSAHAVPDNGQRFVSNYVAMPVGNKMVMVTWFNGGVGGDGAITDVFLFNFQTGVVSDVAPDPVNGPESLGTVDVLAQGATRIPPP
jgi:hypothetical protein